MKPVKFADSECPVHALEVLRAMGFRRPSLMSSFVNIFGVGYVGPASAAYFARLGHRVTGIDVSLAKVEMLQSSRTLIIEAQMDELVADAHWACRLHFTTVTVAAVQESDISFACVGAPSLRSGKLDLSHVERISREIGADGGTLDEGICW
jgi:GDP-mannose 6-dehydrogenase